MRKIKLIVIHCTDSPNFRKHTAADIHRWHQEKNYDGIGYHYFIQLTGDIEKGRPDYWIGAHARGYNDESIGIVLVGRTIYTAREWQALDKLLTKLEAKYPDAAIVGHNQLDAKKTCPGFDVQQYLMWRKRLK